MTTQAIGGGSNSVAPTNTPNNAPNVEQQWQSALSQKERNRQKFIINGSVQLFIQTQVNGKQTKIKTMDDTE